MFADFSYPGPRMLGLDSTYRKLSVVAPLERPKSDLIEAAMRSLGLITANNHELTSCSPVISHDDIQRIRR